MVEIDELSDADKAVEWARGLVDDPVLRRAFGDGVIAAVSAREEETPGDS